MNEKENLAAELKKNTVIMEETLASNNLQILQIAYVPSGVEFQCEIIIECATLKGNALKNSINLKLNLYDAAGNVFFTDCCYFSKSKFTGYDTQKIYCLDENTLKRAAKARVWAV